MNFDVEFLVRGAAALAAIALVASPALVAAWKAVQGWLAKRPTPEGDAALDDMRLVLEIANRLRLQGCDDGVDLCEKLLNVMLTRD